jgi:hypothetical protein
MWPLAAGAGPVARLRPIAHPLPARPPARPARARCRFELAQAREAFATLLQRKVLGKMLLMVDAHAAPLARL